MNRNTNLLFVDILILCLILDIDGYVVSSVSEIDVCIGEVCSKKNVTVISGNSYNNNITFFNLTTGKVISKSVSLPIALENFAIDNYITFADVSLKYSGYCCCPGGCDMQMDTCKSGMPTYFQAKIDTCMSTGCFWFGDGRLCYRAEITPIMNYSVVLNSHLNSQNIPVKIDDKFGIVSVGEAIKIGTETIMLISVELDDTPNDILPVLNTTSGKISYVFTNDFDSSKNCDGRNIGWFKYTCNVFDIIIEYNLLSCDTDYFTVTSRNRRFSSYNFPRENIFINPSYSGIEVLCPNPKCYISIEYSCDSTFVENQIYIGPLGLYRYIKNGNYLLDQTGYQNNNAMLYYNGGVIKWNKFGDPTCYTSKTFGNFIRRRKVKNVIFGMAYTDLVGFFSISKIKILSGYKNCNESTWSLITQGNNDICYKQCGNAIFSITNITAGSVSIVCPEDNLNIQCGSSYYSFLCGRITEYDPDQNIDGNNTADPDLNHHNTDKGNSGLAWYWWLLISITAIIVMIITVKILLKCCTKDNAVDKININIGAIGEVEKKSS